MEMKYKMMPGYNWGVTCLFWGLFCFYKTIYSEEWKKE